MPPIEKPKGRRGRDGRKGGRRGSGRRREKLRTDAEQLDYEMELMRAQHEGREEEFRAEERAKMHARRAASLDAEMDEYFKKKVDKTADADPVQVDSAAKDGADKSEGAGASNGAEAAG